MTDDEQLDEEPAATLDEIADDLARLHEWLKLATGRRAEIRGSDAVALTVNPYVLQSGIDDLGHVIDELRRRHEMERERATKCRAEYYRERLNAGRSQAGERSGT